MKLSRRRRQLLPRAEVELSSSLPIAQYTATSSESQQNMNQLSWHLQDAVRMINDLYSIQETCNLHSVDAHIVYRP